MKLRLMELHNVRRFGDKTAVLGPFGDGLTTLTAANEQGKSTFFDALHALLFSAHNSKSQDIRGLQPYSGGPVSIAAVIELDGREYRIEKTFLQKASARVLDVATGQILHQGGEAESWIEAHILQAHKGPTGLLWVRQGTIDIDPKDKGKDADNIATRRDLMSSVRGQIDAVTGGRRMDKIAERARRELDEFATKGLRPKAGGPWKAAEDEAANLRDRRDKLQLDVAALADDLRLKRQSMARLSILDDPQRQAERNDQISLATKALEDARQSAQKIQSVENTLLVLRSDRENIERRIAEVSSLRQRRISLGQDITARQQAYTHAKSETASALAAVVAAQTAIAEAENARRRLNDELKLAHGAAKTRLRWQRLGQLFDLLARLKPLQSKRAAARAALAGPEILPADLAHLEDVAQRISIAQQQQQTHFASVTLTPEAGGLAKINGTVITETQHQLIDQALTISVAGFGTIALHPAEGGPMGIEDPTHLKADLASQLTELGFSDLASARKALLVREQASKDEQIAIAEIRGLAPDGIAALESEWADICLELNHPIHDVPPALSPLAGPDAEALESQLNALDADVAKARDHRDALQQKATLASSDEAAAKGLLDHQTAELQALSKPEDEDAIMAGLQADLDHKQQQERAAQDNLGALQSTAPNLAAIEAKYIRLTNARDEDHKEIQQLKLVLARIDGAIERQTENSVEEKLAETEAQLERYESRAARYELEAKAWNLLISHLDAARKEAQDTYFEPIRQELGPLLAQIYEGAEFELDPDKMLVGKIIRRGVEDEVADLSGGTYEQIAILTRLAFARLFAKQGHHVPVILDDALVHSDDDRISTMFDVLAHMAQDQQVIVLSCRTRAFDDLGGTRTAIQIR